MHEIFKQIIMLLVLLIVDDSLDDFVVVGFVQLLAAVLSQIERSRGVVTSGVLFVYWLLLTVINVIPMYSYILLDVRNYF